LSNEQRIVQEEDNVEMLHRDNNLRDASRVGVGAGISPRRLQAAHDQLIAARELLQAHFIF